MDLSKAPIAPFGFVPGEPQSSIKIIRGKPGDFEVVAWPRNRVETFYEYRVYSTEKTGICGIMASAQSVIPPDDLRSMEQLKDRDGSKTKAVFADLKRLLEVRYGEPFAVRDKGPKGAGKEWANQLYNEERTYDAVWRNIRAPDGGIGVSGIRLMAAGMLQDTPEVVVAFYFDNWEECRAINKAREDQDLSGDASKF